MERPKSTVGMVYDMSQWFPDKGAVKTRPAIHQWVIQRPLTPGGDVPFTVFYYASDRLWRVDGVLRPDQDAVTALGIALENHWWDYDPDNALEAPRKRRSGS